MTNNRTFYEGAYARERWQKTEESRFAKVWYRALLDHVLPVLPLDGRRVLEIGAGYGHLVPYLEPRVARYVGLDLALSAVRQLAASSAGRAYGVVADGAALPFPDRSFDLALCFEVIEHVAEPARLVEECFRVVRPGGHVVFSSPSYWNLFIVPVLLAELGVPAARRYMNLPPLARTTTGFALRRLLAGHGRIVLQRGVRLHPPLFERLGGRSPARRRLNRINEWITSVESRWGDRSPLKWLGLHTLLLVERTGSPSAGADHRGGLGASRSGAGS
jgi:SAM-dependent methyltransferase